jgi:hypothetical protein
MSFARRLCALSLVGLLAMTADAADDRDRALQLIDGAVQALGGERYRSVRALVSRGVYTAFNGGERGVPVDFVDTFVYPDRNRTEFGKKKSRVVQSNAGDKGWKYDGARKVLVEQTAEEIHAFHLYARASVDNLLRKDWRRERATVSYIGRKEVAPRQWAEAVVVEYEDGLHVELMFDPTTGVPVLSRYREVVNGAAATVETHYFQYLDWGGVKVARIFDLYRDGVQTARVVVDAVEVNPTIATSYFDRPANLKSIE